jgi:hypothetical protein
MFSYVIIEEPILVQILFEDNVVDESGPWESLVSAINWAEQYVSFKNSGLSEPEIVF